jgi:PAS domain-containing protein
LQLLAFLSGFPSRDPAPQTTAPEEHLAAIVACCDDKIISKNLEGHVLTWNAGAERLYGDTAGEMVGRSTTRIIPAERMDPFERIMARRAELSKLQREALELALVEGLTHQEVAGKLGIRPLTRPLLSGAGMRRKESGVRPNDAPGR